MEGSESIKKSKLEQNEVKYFKANMKHGEVHIKFTVHLTKISKLKVAHLS